MTDLISDCKLAACVNIRLCGCLPLCVRSVMDWGYIWHLYRCLFKLLFFFILFDSWLMLNKVKWAQSVSSFLKVTLQFRLNSSVPRPVKDLYICVYDSGVYQVSMKEDFFFATEMLLFDQIVRVYCFMLWISPVACFSRAAIPLANNKIHCSLFFKIQQNPFSQNVPC